MIYVVTYDLHAPGRSYDAITKLLSVVPSTHPEGSVWFIDSLQSADVWAKALKSVVDSNDEVFVARLSSKHEWQAYNQDNETSLWLNSPSRNW
jgi:hypothetical protein